MDKVSIGDRVQIINDNAVYTTATQYWREMGCPEGFVSGRGYELDNDCFALQVGTVVAIHPTRSGLCAVRTDVGTALVNKVCLAPADGDQPEEAPNMAEAPERAPRFQEGDRVTLRESIFSRTDCVAFRGGQNPLDMPGTVLPQNPDVPEWDYHVLWDNGRDNYYDEQDLDSYLDLCDDTGPLGQAAGAMSDREAVGALLNRLGIDFEERATYIRVHHQGKALVEVSPGVSTDCLDFNFDNDGRFGDLEVL